MAAKKKQVTPKVPSAKRESTRVAKSGFDPNENRSVKKLSKGWGTNENRSVKKLSKGKAL